jgi:hypothetical protein
MRHVALIKNEASKYDVLAAMTESLAVAFRRKGIKAPVYEVFEEGFSALAQQIRNDLPETPFCDTQIGFCVAKRHFVIRKLPLPQRCVRK